MTDRARPKGRQIFYGWWIVLVVAIGTFMGYGPVIGFTFSVFFNPLTEEFKWGRTETSLAFSLSLLAMCVSMPLVGRLVDRFGARKVIIPSVLILGVCLISLRFLSGRLWFFYAIYILMGIVGSGSSQVPYFTVISHWFNEKRGLALGIAAIGAGVATFILPSLVYASIVRAGWRATYVLLGVVLIVVTVPVVGFFLKESPEMVGLLPDGGMESQSGREELGQGAAGLSGRQARRTDAFWIMCTAFFLVATSVIGCLIHMVPMLTDRHISAQTAAFATSLIGGASLLGGTGAGYLVDRFRTVIVTVVFFSGASVGICLWLSGTTGNLVFIASVLVGLAMGAQGNFMAYLVGRYFGLRAFGEIYSFALTSFTLGGVVGPLLMGISFDMTGSYRLALGLFLLGTLTATGLMTRLRPYQSEALRAGGAVSSALSETFK